MKRWLSYNFSLREPMTWVCIAGFVMLAAMVVLLTFFPQVRAKC